MTRKRFKKLLMSAGVNRDAAERLSNLKGAKLYIDDVELPCSHEIAWAAMMKLKPTEEAE